MADQRWCDACLGSAQCWICGGDGVVDCRSGAVDCPSCVTTGICRYCAIPSQPQLQSQRAMTLPRADALGNRPLG